MVFNYLARFNVKSITKGKPTPPKGKPIPKPTKRGGY